MVSNDLKRQLFYFGVVGVSATVTNYVVAVGVHESLGINLYAAQLVGYGFAVMISFFGHGMLTFKAKISSIVFVKFIAVSLSTLWLSEIVLFLLESVLNLHHRISLLVVVFTIPVTTFFLSKLWVFRERKRKY